MNLTEKRLLILRSIAREKVKTLDCVVVWRVQSHGDRYRIRVKPGGVAEVSLNRKVFDEGLPKLVQTVGHALDLVREEWEMPVRTVDVRALAPDPSPEKFSFDPPFPQQVAARALGKLLTSFGPRAVKRAREEPKGDWLRRATGEFGLSRREALVFWTFARWEDPMKNLRAQAEPARAIVQGMEL